MKVLDVVITVLFVFGILALAANWLLVRENQKDAQEEHLRQVRVRYPNEEAIAKKACGKRRLMYWWLEDPRKGGATMHVRCAGQVNVVTDVKF